MNLIADLVFQPKRATPAEYLKWTLVQSQFWRSDMHVRDDFPEFKNLSNLSSNKEQ